MDTFFYKCSPVRASGDNIVRKLRTRANIVSSGVDDTLRHTPCMTSQRTCKNGLDIIETEIGHNETSSTTI